MRSRLLGLCLLAYPRALRERDHAYLRDLALDLAERDGLPSQALSLVRGGVSERRERRRRRPGAGLAAAVPRIAVACFALAVVAIAAAGLTGPALGSEERVEVERFVCVAKESCDEVRRHVAARLREGWDCTTRTRRGQPRVAARCTLGVSAARASDSPAGIDREVQDFLDRVLPEGASGSLVAARGADMVHCAGFGLADRERQIAARCNTVYDVMSMTKQFTAAAILKLAMMGGLRVTDPLTRFIGRVPADKREITLHQLLTHTSGLVEVLGGDYDRLTRGGLLTAALDSELQSRPGTEYLYSNAGYSVLAAIVEKTSGMGYEEFLTKHLFEPARMTQTGYVLPTWERSHVAVEYDSRGRPQGRPFDHRWAGDGPYWNLRGNGGMLSTARDMFRWHVALEGDDLLDQHAKDRMFQPHVREEPGGDSYYGYGWVILPNESGPVAWHNGGNAWSYGEVARILDDGVMVFWVTNRDQDKARGWSLSRLGPKLTEGVADRVRDGN